jgi:hypothetical protein
MDPEEPFSVSKLLFSLFFVGALLSASTLDLSTTCIINGGPNPQTQYGGAGCSVSDGLSSAGASASGGWNVSDSVSGPELAPSDTPFNTLIAGFVGSAETQMKSPQVGVWGGYPTATATATLSVNLETAGPQRQGYLEFFGPTIEEDRTADEVFYGTFSLSMGPVSASCNSASIVVDYCGPLEYMHAYKVPVEIGAGETYLLTVSQAAFSSTAPVDGLDWGTVYSSVSVQFLEADGSTPAPMHEAPEPASWGLLSMAFAGGSLFRLRNALCRIQELYGRKG